MNKINKTAAACLICCLSVGTAVWGADIIGGQIEKAEVTRVVESCAENSRNVLESNLHASDLIFMLHEQGMEDDEVQEALDAYAALIALYEPSKEEKTQMLQMVNNGKDLRKICDIYAFLTDTVEGFSLLNDMYTVGEELRFSDSYWLENVYNYVTQNKHGTLSLKDIESYIKKGITIEEIGSASVLSRGGSGTIAQILDEKEHGEQWTDIFNKYYQKETAVFSSAQSDNSASDLLEGIRAARVSGLKPSVCVKNSEAAREAQNKIMFEAQSFARKAGEGLLKKEELTQKIYEDAADAGISIADIKKLQDLGFTSSEIKRAAKEAQTNGTDLMDTLNSKAVNGLR